MKNAKLIVVAIATTISFAFFILVNYYNAKLENIFDINKIMDNILKGSD
jgi:hypothetical protein